MVERREQRYNLAMFTVYVIYNKDHDKIYIGQTKDIDNRISLHNHKMFENSYTSRYSGEWQIIYHEEYPNRQTALKREKQLKRWRREMKIDLIEQSNPEWKDLSNHLI